MKDRSIKMAIIIPVLAALVIGIAAMILIVGRSSYATAKKLTNELVHSSVTAYANEFKAVSTGAYASISSVTPIIEKAAINSQTPREEIIGILEGALIGNPQIVSIWTCWEPNALDGKDEEYKNQFLHDKTGRFIPVIIRDDNQIVYEPLIGYESPETGEYYHGAKDTAKPYITDPYEYVLGGKNTLLYTIAIPIIQNSRVVGVAGADVNIQELMDTMNSGKILADGYIYTLSPNGLISTHSDESLWLSDFRSLWLGEYKDEVENVLANGGEYSMSAYSEQINTEVEFTMDSVMIGDTGRYWAICGVVPKSNITASSRNMLILIIVGGLILIIGICIVISLLVNKVLSELPNLTAAAETLAVGDVSAINMQIGSNTNTQNEIVLLSHAFAKMATGVSDQANALSFLAQGDYSINPITVRSDKDIMNIAINNMIDNTNEIMDEIQMAASQVSSASGQVANGAQALASGSAEQAATLEEFSSSVSEIQEQAKNSENLAIKTKEDMLLAGNYLNESMAKMSDMGEAMKGINQGSHEIVKIIKVIDDIAFQTNILALNAAVEAARAGQHGKGFAVVADEVRNLAAKSAAAAKETADLIQNSVTNVEKGTSTANEATESMVKVNKIAGENAQAMETLSAMSNQQTVSIGEINVGMSQISTVVQANSATSEESAAAAEEMNAQSNMLNDIIKRFKLRNSINSFEKSMNPTNEIKQLQSHQSANGEELVDFGTTDKY